MHKCLILLSLLVAGEFSAIGQSVGMPRIHWEAPAGQRCFTNYNPSVSLGDTVLPLVFDSLRKDGTATIVTVYETDADSVVGLWEMGSGGNRVLWLNSQNASYEDFSVRYRRETEKGVIIHSMTYKYPSSNSTYDGHDTLFIGKEGTYHGEKNFCAWYYYPGGLGRMQQRVLESALAVRYGALLHGAYIDSHQDILWNPFGGDSLHSAGVCGIGRDDSVSLMQTKSAIRGDILTMESVGIPGDLTYVMLGHDGGTAIPVGKSIVIDGKAYKATGREWKVRAHAHGGVPLLRVSCALPWAAEDVKMMLIADDSTKVISAARGTDTLIFDSIRITAEVDYYISILTDTASIIGGTKETAQTMDDRQTSSKFDLCVQPNPTRGQYRVDVIRDDGRESELRIVDSHGRVIEQRNTGETTRYTHNGVIETDGAYYITVSGNGERKTVKLIVTK